MRKRNVEELDLLISLRALVTKAGTMVAEVIEHGDPLWYGPDNSWQTGDSMTRMADLSLVPDGLDELAARAQGFGWHEVAAITRALAGVARSAREGSEALAFNQQAVSRVESLSASLLKRLDTAYFANLDALAAGKTRQSSRRLRISRRLL